MTHRPVLTLDFETYYSSRSRYSLRHLTVPEYVGSPHFFVQGLAIRYAGGRLAFETDVPAILQDLQETYGEHLSGATVVGHNLAFDLYILNHVYGLRPVHFVDTLQLANAVLGRRNPGGNSLRALAQQFDLPTKGSLDFMDGVRVPDARQLAEIKAYATRDVEITFQLLGKLLPKLSNRKIELRCMRHTIRMFTERSLHVDQVALDELIDEVETDDGGIVDRMGVDRGDISRDSRFVVKLRAALEKTGRAVPMKTGTSGLVPATAKTDVAMQKLAEDSDPEVRELARARLSLKSNATVLARLRKLKSITVSTGGTLPVRLVYHGAHTGRFSGAGGFNVQNLARSGVGGQIRGLLRPKPGHSFVIADYAQIEPRVLAVISRQTDLVAAFEEGRDVYSEFATATFGQEVRKPLPDDSPSDKKRLEALRCVGKRAVLGLGYGMGALRFLTELQSDPDVSHLFSLGELSPSIVWKIVRQYREQYSMISGYWSWFDSEIRSEAQNVAEHAGLSVEPGGADVTLELPLPSGRVLRYRRVRFSDDPREFRCLDEAGNEYVCQSNKAVLTYGGDRDLHGRILTENFVQATARDILVEAILALEAEGLPVVLHIHDEVVVEVPENEAEEALHRVRGIMCRTPQWLEVCPLAVEARIADRFGK